MNLIEKKDRFSDSGKMRCLVRAEVVCCLKVVCCFLGLSSLGLVSCQQEQAEAQQGARVGGREMMLDRFAGGFDFSEDESGNMLMTSNRGDFLETYGHTNEYGEARFRSDRQYQAKHFEESEYWENEQFYLSSNSTYNSDQEYTGANESSRWSEQSFARADKRAYDGEREFDTHAFHNADLRARADGQASRYNENSSEYEGRDYQRGSEAREHASVPKIIRSLAEGGYVDGQQVRALSQ